MSYFEDVYLKRLNIDGITQQERVKTRKEKEFDKLFLKKTEYLANIYQINELGLSWWWCPECNNEDFEILDNYTYKCKKCGNIEKIPYID